MRENGLRIFWVAWTFFSAQHGSGYVFFLTLICFLSLWPLIHLACLYRDTKSDE